MLCFLQQNAEWMCAIAIVFFTIIQCWISHSQYRQDLRFRRLDLANKLDEVFAHFAYTKEDCIKRIDWLMENQVSFMFLLNKSEQKLYWQLYEYISSLVNPKDKDYWEKKEYSEKYYAYLMQLDSALASAKYGIQEYKNKLKQYEKSSPKSKEEKFTKKRASRKRNRADAE